MSHHMRREDREIKDKAVLEDILRKGKYATMALCRDNEPYLVTLSYGYDSAEGTLYFHCASEGQKVEFVRQNPQACATVIEDNGYVQGECEHHYRSVILRGKIEIVSTLEGKMHGLEVLVQHLETNPDGGFRQKMNDKQDRIALVSIWKLKIEAMAGKRGK